MTLQEIAHYLHGRAVGHEVPQQVEQHAGSLGMVIAYGVGEHLVRFRGAIDEDAAAPGMVFLDHHGIGREGDYLVPSEWKAWRKTAASIEALWCEVEPYTWSYATTIPHCTFDILEPAGLYCRGIVFSLSDLA